MDDKAYVYIGSYSFDPNSGAGQSPPGILVCEFDRDDGSLREVARTPADGPSFLTLSPERGRLFAACRGATLTASGVGAVMSFSIDRETGALSELGSVDVPLHPAYLTLDPSGERAFAACTFAGSIAVVPIDGDGRVHTPVDVVQHPGRSLSEQGLSVGRITPGSVRVGTPFPHSVAVDELHRHILVADLGLDKILVYRLRPGEQTLAACGELEVGKPGGAHPLDAHSIWDASVTAGPRHLVFGHGGHVLYVTNEVGSTVSWFDYDPQIGVGTVLGEISSLPDGADASDFDNSAADLVVHPSSDYLYVSNRGHDSVSLFALDPATGQPTFRGNWPSEGRGPRSLTMSDDGRWLLCANLASGSVSTYAVEPDGALRLSSVIDDLPSPACVRFLDSARLPAERG